MNRVNRTLLITLAALCVPTQATTAQTAFTYQGVLKSGGGAFSGTADVTVRLFDVASGGTALASDQFLAVPVVDGMFTIEPDFGSGAFTGGNRWIEFEIDSQTLTPRQPLRPTPYAMHALTSASSEQWASTGSAITNQNTGFVGINRDYTVGLEWFGVHAPVNSGYGGMYVSTEGASAKPFYGYSAGTEKAWTYMDGPTGDWRINVDGDRVTVTDQGLVGIGTTTPEGPLHVVGTNTNRTIYGENSSVSSGTGVYGSSNGISGQGVFGSSAGTNGTGVFGSASGGGNSTGVVAQATSTGGRGVHASATASSGTTMGLYATVNSPSGYSGFFAGVAGSRTYFQRSVGIGTQNPTAQLHIASSTTGSAPPMARIESTGDGTAAIGFSGQFKDFMIGTNRPGDGTTLVNNFFIYDETAAATRLLINTQGQVAIGINDADARLLVRGVTGEDAFRVRVEGGTKLLVKDNGGVAVGANYGTVPDNGMAIAGAVAIGTSNPSTFLLAVNGSAAKPGGGSWSVFSDARLKHDIQPLEAGMLDRLLSIHGYTFRYDDTAIENRLALPGVQTGLIAQEVREVFPEWIGEDAEGYLYITERGLTAIMIEALREMRSEKDQQIELLEQRNNELAARLERLESLIERR